MTAIDARTGMVTAREIASRRTFEFKVSDPALLKSLKVGQKISADLKAMTVTLPAARLGAQPVQVRIHKAEPVSQPTGAQGGSSMGATGSAATSGSTKTKTTSGGLGSIKPDTSNVKASEGDTATAARGRPAPPSDQRGAATSGQAGAGAKKQGYDLQENKRAKPAPSGSPAGAKGQSQAASAQEPADEDAQDDPEPVEKPKPRAVPSLKLPTMRAGAKGTKLTEYADAQKLLDEIAKGIAAREIDVALLGGEKYKINKCLGVKASAGTFKMKFASPNARIEGSGARLTFRIDKVSINALKIRIKPNAGNPLKVCHWSKKHTVGGAATDIRYELRFDAILDLQQCKLGSLSNVKHRLDIGGLNLKPLQNDLDRAAKNMIEDAYNNAANFNMSDRIIASANAFLGVQCHK